MIKTSKAKSDKAEERKNKGDDEMINVCFIADENYVLPTLVAIKSLIINSKHKVCVNVVTSLLSEDSQKLLKQLATKNCEIKIIISSNPGDGIDTKHLYVSKAAMLKFALPQIFSNLDKVLYIDGDVLILDDLYELYNADLKDNYVAAVDDINISNSHTHYKEMGLKRYFNSGVMLLNLKKMRQDNCTDKLIEYKKNEKYHYFMDQDCFNFCFNERVKYIDAKYNFLNDCYNFSCLKNFYNFQNKEIHSIIKNHIIKHFAGGIKVWKDVSCTDFAQWYKYFNLLPESDFKKKQDNIYKQQIKSRRKNIIKHYFQLLFYTHKGNKKKYRFFGIPLFYTRKEENKKVISFLGMKLTRKRNECENFNQKVLNNSYLWQMQRVHVLHEKVFTQFKNKHQGKDVVIIATGPSLNDFEPIENAIYIGVNRAFSVKKLTLDYLFMQDYTVLKSYIEDSVPYKNKKLVRFYGIEPYTKIDNFIVPESVAIRHGALRYYVHSTSSETPELPDTFASDLSSEELYGKGSIVFPAIQFALWTNPKRIYLVGCDCSNAGHFNAKDSSQGCEDLIKDYHLLKKFAETYYPETEIISVNPVGLKGLFKDLWQRKEK